ncbi:ISL3 family transposase [Alkalihalobacillus oceani]|uniref:ISL3 family transposase n=2 Tax=Halalkalibacter oceani TaxID=1653776 RepID=A0A9X2IPQ3_9BACI|nr:ISL3 family transposase [Halalkalibacter oceani]
MQQKSIMKIPGLKEVNVTKIEEREDMVAIHVEVPRKPHECPACQTMTTRVHDYRIQKIQHLKWFERKVALFYRKRRYACPCGKKFAETVSFVKKYQRQTIEWNQALGMRVIEGKNFTDTAKQFHTSPTTVMRRFDHLSASLVKEVDQLPPVIAIDEYKADTQEGTYQLILADAQTRRPLDILPDRSAKTLQRYLEKKGEHVQIVVMDLSYSFKSAVQKALGSPVIIGDRFHFSRYMIWALEAVRRTEQKAFHPYDRKKCKRLRSIFYKRREELTERQLWYVERYLSLSDALREAYELKEAYMAWFDRAKEWGKEGKMVEVKEGLYAFYEKVEQSHLDAFQKAIRTFRNWETEILNSFAFGYTNGFVEGLNNQTKVIKRNAFGFRRYDRLRNRILLHHQYKDITFGVG